jgi:hypothetical protein
MREGGFRRTYPGKVPLERTGHCSSEQGPGRAVISTPAGDGPETYGSYIDILYSISKAAWKGKISHKRQARKVSG